MMLSYNMDFTIVYVIVSAVLSICVVEAEPINLRLMTFNTWHMGQHVPGGLFQIAEHIRGLNPDVVALQEVQEQPFRLLLRLLGPGWFGVHKMWVGHPDVGLITRHSFNVSSFGQTTDSVGCEVLIRRDANRIYPIGVWSVHSDYQDYGPYKTCDKRRFKRFDSDEIQRGEFSRLRGLVELGENNIFQSHTFKQIPMFVLGDFNTPSHLDWVDYSRQLHCNWSMPWPASRQMFQLGFRDAFRDFWPDPLRDPGNTWSPVVKLSDDGQDPEPQDRIDFIYYKGPAVFPAYVWTYEGQGSWVQWPSDHSSVVADFVFYTAT